MAPHYWYVQPYWLLAYPLVWAIVFIRYEGQCEKPKNRVRTISSHTFLFNLLSSGNCGGLNGLFAL